MDAHELAARELVLELVDAVDRGLEAAFLGDEPDIVAVRLREVHLRPAQQDHALAADADDPRLRGLDPGSGRSRSSGSPRSEPKTASVPIGWSARKTGRSVIRQGSRLSSVTICVEPTQLWSS